MTLGGEICYLSNAFKVGYQSRPIAYENAMVPACEEFFLSRKDLVFLKSCNLLCTYK